MVAREETTQMSRILELIWKESTPHFPELVRAFTRYRLTLQKAQQM